MDQTMRMIRLLLRKSGNDFDSVEYPGEPVVLRHSSGAKINMAVRDLSSIFFFQAEDGIRDYKVTGVQTCALPIWNAGERVSGLHLLVHQRPCRHRTPRRGPDAVRERARLLQPSRPARRARRSADPGAVGPLRADLQHGRPHRLGAPAVAAGG